MIGDDNMPSYANLAKNVLSINSIDDIPEKYRNAVLEKINQGEDNTLYGQITPGEKGSIESSLEQLNMEFNDSSLLYFGHGTPLDSTVDSILITGLKVKKPEKIRAYDSHLRGLESTTIGFTTGSDSLYSNERNLLDNWPHKARWHSAKRLLHHHWPRPRHPLLLGRVLFLLQ